MLTNNYVSGIIYDACVTDNKQDFNIDLWKDDE